MLSFQKMSFKKYSTSVTHFTKNVLLLFLLTLIPTTGFSAITHGRICLSTSMLLYLSSSTFGQKGREPSIPSAEKIGKPDCTGSIRYITTSTTLPHPFRPASSVHHQIHWITKEAQSWTRGSGRAVMQMELYPSSLWKRCPCIQTPSPSWCWRMLRLTVNQRKGNLSKAQV